MNFAPLKMVRSAGMPLSRRNRKYRLASAELNDLYTDVPEGRGSWRRSR
jgi:hypothetical protein